MHHLLCLLKNKNLDQCMLLLTPFVSNHQLYYSDTVIRQVRAMYDFEAAENNEISFAAGDIINVFACRSVN